MSYEEGASSPSGDEDGDVGRTIRTSPAKVPRLGTNGVRLLPGFPELQILTTGAELQTLAHMVQAEVAAVQQSSGGDAGTSTSLVTVADGLDTAVHSGDAVQACKVTCDHPTCTVVGVPFPLRLRLRNDTAVMESFEVDMQDEAEVEGGRGGWVFVV